MHSKTQSPKRKNGGEPMSKTPSINETLSFQEAQQLIELNDVEFINEHLRPRDTHSKSNARVIDNLTALYHRGLVELPFMNCDIDQAEPYMFCMVKLTDDGHTLKKQLMDFERL